MNQRCLGLSHLTPWLLCLYSPQQPPGTRGIAGQVGSHQHHGRAVEDGLQVHEDGRDACQLLQEAHQYRDENRPVHAGVLGLCP